MKSFEEYFEKNMKNNTSKGDTQSNNMNNKKQFDNKNNKLNNKDGKKPFGKKVALIFEFFSECSYIVLTNQ